MKVTGGGAPRGSSLTGAVRDMLPDAGPWVTAALWYPFVSAATPSEPLTDELGQILEHKLAPLVLDYIRSTRSAVAADVLLDLEKQKFALILHSQRVAARAAEVIGRLRDDGVQPIVIKGPGIAAHYASQASRPYSDVDILIAPADFARCLRRLKAHGWLELPDNRQPWPFFDRHCREAVNLLDGQGGSIDLHHHISPWLWSQDISVPAVVARATDVSAAGQTFPCADAADNLVVASLHLINDHFVPGGRLSIWRDVAQLAHAVDPDVAAERAGRYGLDGYLRSVLQALPGPARPAALIDRLGSTGVKHPRRLLRLIVPDRSRGSVVNAHLLRLPVANAALYLLGTIFPDRDFLRSHYGPRHGGLRRYWADAFKVRHGDRVH
ncbi:nucleotidyltransferase family protein [Jatrophihabitans telluris]|uniref:Nucleotidyltransferase family protein n=1 Tax=Jatrophihabitans telluris TaxID=2038343 RepID=A0ABY4QXE6_9ACTN|nr:nucleotidyltransferase family protein [Jatrophihabitans telluris]UQX87877.1 nucleotidyltransferase family protein [Jatrophihabitans telluris]